MFDNVKNFIKKVESLKDDNYTENLVLTTLEASLLKHEIDSIIENSAYNKFSIALKRAGILNDTMLVMTPAEYVSLRDECKILAAEVINKIDESN